MRKWCCLVRCLQLQEQVEFDTRMHEAIAEIQDKLKQEADEQLMERKRYEETLPNTRELSGPKLCANAPVVAIVRIKIHIIPDALHDNCCIDSRGLTFKYEELSSAAEKGGTRYQFMSCPCHVHAMFMPCFAVLVHIYLPTCVCLRLGICLCLFLCVWF